jgi:hypothetical protein
MGIAIAESRITGNASITEKEKKGNNNPIRGNAYSQIANHKLRRKKWQKK